MNNSLSILPANYDLPYLIDKAGVTNHYGFVSEDDGVHFRYRVEDYDAVQAAIASYPVDYLEVLAPRAIMTASRVRDEKIAGFEFGGMTIEIDLETKANLTGLVSGLDRNESVEGIDWSLGEGNFVYLDRATVYALADAVFMHVQAAFTAHRAIVTEIKAAEDITALEAIDIENHPAWG